ncbi:uncharacterized protein METZ01_LOCUS86795 [marine metagenome]|uniref:Uncharacterized protein n=1 Tax=marine metagenome TaxID=408172 RepID=A0A381V1V6_9ZZZZ
MLLLLMVPGCGETPSEFRPLPAALGDLRGVAMGFERLQPLDQGIYSAWLRLEKGDRVGIGTFNVNSNGQPVDGQGSVIDRFTASETLFSAISILIAIEPTGAIQDAPSEAVILQGPFIDGIATMAVPFPPGIGEATGSYRVFTPTDGPNTNEGSGVWAANANGEPTLALADINNLYMFEHFMVINGIPLTMGRFKTTDTRDLRNPWSGPLTDTAPAVPGEDFVANAPAGFTFPADLSGSRLLVTLEALYGDRVEPSQLIVLEGTLPAVVGGEIIQLTNQTANFPTGTAVIY